jgi:hypothetical protein
MKRRLVILLVAGAAVSGISASAHHSFSSTYLEDRQMTLEGELVQILYRNPHSFVAVMAPDENNKLQRWAVEWGGGEKLGQQGVTRDTLKLGDHVIVTGHPGRNPADHRVCLMTIFRPKDGWKWTNER